MTGAEFIALLARYSNGPNGDVGPVVELPAGTITVSSPITIQDRADLVIRGQGELATKLVYNGTTGTVFLTMENCKRCHLENLWFDGNSKALHNIHLTTSAAPPWPGAGRNYFRRVSSTSATNSCFFIDNTTNDEGNDNNEFESCTAGGSGGQVELYGYRIKGEAAINTKFKWSFANYCTNGIYAEDGCHLIWEDSQFTNNDVDILLGTNGKRLTVIGNRCEGSRQFIVSNDDVQQALAIYIDRINSDYDDGQDGVSPVYGDYLVDVRTSGPVYIGNATFYLPEEQIPLLFRFRTTEAGTLTIDGVTFTQNSYPNDDVRHRPFHYDETYYTLIDNGFKYRGLGNPVFTSFVQDLLINDRTTGRDTITLSKTSYASTEYHTVTLAAVHQTYTADATGDTIDIASHPFVDDNRLTFRAYGGSIPSGMNTNMWVVNATANDFQVATTQGGSAVDITSAGSGTLRCWLILGDDHAALTDSDGTKLRSFAISIVANLTSASGDVEIMNAGGIPVWFDDEGGGTHALKVGASDEITVTGITLPTSTDIPICLSYDRDFTTVRIRVSNLVTQQSATLDVTDNDYELQLGSKATSPVSGAFVGTITPLVVWDRPLNESEVDAEVDAA